MTQPGDLPSPKKLKFADLIQPKVAVPTSIGELFVRTARLSDWETIGDQTPAVLGEKTVQQLTNRASDKEVRGPLGDEDYSRLQEGDFRALGGALASLNGWGEVGEGDARTALGTCVEKAIEKHRETNRKMLADMQASLKSNYAFLDKAAFDKLQSQMTGLAQLRNSMDRNKLAYEALSAFEGADKASELLKASKSMEALGAPRNLEHPFKQVNLPNPAIYRPIDPADTKLGRATLENVRISRETSEKLDSLVELVAGLNQTVIQDVLPAWVKQVEADQASANQAFQQAATNLRWTQVAVVISIVVTLGATWWQVRVAHEIDHDNSEQQKRIEKLMTQQLEIQRQQAEQYARDTESMRAILERLTPPKDAPSKRNN